MRLFVLSVFVAVSAIGLSLAYGENVVIKSSGKKVTSSTTPAASTTTTQTKTSTTTSVFRTMPSSAMRQPSNLSNQNAMEERMMQQMKEKDPAAYQKYLEKKELGKKISAIVAAYHSGKLPEQDARQQLTSLVEASIDVNNYGKNIDAQINLLGAQLEHLKKIKANPRLIIEERVNAYLGKSSPGIKR